MVDKATASKRIAEAPGIPLSTNSGVAQLSLGLFGIGGKAPAHSSDRAHLYVDAISSLNYTWHTTVLKRLTCFLGVGLLSGSTYFICLVVEAYG